MYSTRVLMSNADTAEIIFPQRDLFRYHLLFLGARLEEAGFGWMLEKQKHSSGLNVIMPERSLQPAAWEEVKERGEEGGERGGEQQKKKSSKSNEVFIMVFATYLTGFSRDLAKSKNLLY